MTVNPERDVYVLMSKPLRDVGDGDAVRQADRREDVAQDVRGEALRQPGCVTGSVEPVTVRAVGYGGELFEVTGARVEYVLRDGDVSVVITAPVLEWPVTLTVTGELAAQAKAAIFEVARAHAEALTEAQPATAHEVDAEAIGGGKIRCQGCDLCVRPEGYFRLLRNSR